MCCARERHPGHCSTHHPWCTAPAGLPYGAYPPPAPGYGAGPPGYAPYPPGMWQQQQYAVAGWQHQQYTLPEGVGVAVHPGVQGMGEQASADRGEGGGGGGGGGGSATDGEGLLLSQQQQQAAAGYEPLAPGSGVASSPRGGGAPGGRV